MALDVHVQRARCIGSKACTSAAPGVFRIGPDNVAVVVDPTAAPDDDILRAEEACPTGAVTVVRSGGGGEPR